jgi:lipid A 3-O-deacylase PagL
MKWFARLIMTTCVAIFALPSIGVCQETASSDRDWDLGIWVAFATGEENSNSFAEAQILSAGPFIGRIIKRQAGHGWSKGNLEYGFSASPLFFQLRPQHLYGIAFEPVILRWNSAHPLGRIKLYMELAGGGVRTNMDLPAGNTSNFNFTVSGGAGFYLHSRSSQVWDLGAHWSHISNANLGIQNPEFNGIQVRLAYHWFR